MIQAAILSNYRDTFPFSEKELFSFRELTRVASEQGVRLVRVSIHSFDREKGVFTNYADFNDSGNLEIFHEDFRPDVVWNRSPSDGKLFSYETLEKAGISIFPSLRLMTIGSDKYETYCFFRDYQPYSMLLKNFFFYPELRKNLTDTVVLKPIRSHSGKGIVFLSPAELLEKREQYEGLEVLYIVQNFTDFSAGISGLVDGIHDVRLMFIGRRFVHATLRVPKAGSLKSNLGAGGTEYVLSKEEIPEGLWKIIPDVLEILDPSEIDFYSIDFGYVAGEDRWYIFELNNSPGVLISEATRESYVQGYYLELSRFLRDNFD